MYTWPIRSHGFILQYQVTGLLWSVCYMTGLPNGALHVHVYRYFVLTESCKNTLYEPRLTLKTSVLQTHYMYSRLHAQLYLLFLQFHIIIRSEYNIVCINFIEWFSFEYWKVIGFSNTILNDRLAPLFLPIGSKTKSIKICAHTFSCALHQRNVIIPRFDWFIVLFASFVIG